MSVAEKYYSFDVSEHYFRLTTECVRLYSNREFVHSTLSDVINDRSASAADVPRHYSANDMKEHLRIIPTFGDKRLEFTISESSSCQINGLIATLKSTIGSELAFAEVVSLMLYDLVVEANSTELLTKLGISSDEAKNYREILKKKP